MSPGTEHCALAVAKWLFGSVVLLASCCCARSTQAAGVPISGDGLWAMFGPPSPRTGAPLVYDSKRRRMIMVGGTNAGDIWSISLSGAAKRQPVVPQGTGPGVRFGHQAGS